jgi:PAS domain S-box-containing protein
MTEKQLHPDDFADLRRRAEEKARADEAQARQSPSPEESGRLLHELHVHQIELEMQNEELRRSQGELETSRARYFDLFDLAPVGYFTLSEKGLILEANVTGAGLLGVGRSDLVKQPFSRFILPEDQDIYYRHRKNLLEAGQRQACELRLVNRAGTFFWAQLETTVSQDSDSGVHAFRAVVSDITDRKRAEEESRHVKQVAEAANAAKSLFLANMSHEIRTPMSAILGMTELALGEELAPAVRDYLQMARESAEMLMDLLNGILDLSRIEAGRFDLESMPFGLRRLMEQVVNPQGIRASEKGLDLVYDLPPEVPDRLVGDPLRLRQVLTNLVGNAVKFTDQGEIIVRGTVKSQDAEQVTLQFSVTDTGIGIAPEQRQRIFASFTQADASTTRQYGGSGLGLTISQKLVELMGGRIWVESQFGRGSTFCFTVRLKLQQEGVAEVGIPDRQVPKPLSPLTRSLRVLLAEDTPANQKLVIHVLTKRGHVVETACNGQQALDLIDQRDFDVNLMDVQMPVMDGFQATAAIRKLPDPRKARLPIIAMTAHALKGDDKRCMEAGMDAYIAKPLDTRELVRLVESLANRQDAD